MLTQSMQKALNDQINAETYSAYLYLSMSAYCQAKDMVGMATWFRVQAQEELVHVAKFFDHVNNRDGRVKLVAIEGPPVEWAAPIAVFDQALQHERKVTQLIHDLMELARAEKDRATENFLQWFVAEQVEEEASVMAVLGKLRLIGDNGGGLYMLDQELGQRTFVMPVTPA